MSKIYIIHENMEWTQHLIKRLEEINVPYEDIDLSDGLLDIQDLPKNGVYYNRMSASSHTRNHRYAPELTEQVLTWLETKGAKVINGVSAINIELSKLKQYIYLQKFGIKTPKTIGAVGRENILKAVKKLDIYPFIIKHNRAGKGLGVRLIKNYGEIKKYISSEEFEDSIDGISLIQEYKKPFDGHIRRAEFIGRKYLYTVKVNTEDGFELCPADSCQLEEDIFCPASSNKIKLIEKVVFNSENINSILKGDKPVSNKFEIIESLSKEKIEQYEKFLNEYNLDVVAIEFIEDENGDVFVYDINTNTNYNADAEKKANKFAMLELAKYLKFELENLEK